MPEVAKLGLNALLGEIARTPDSEFDLISTLRGLGQNAIAYTGATAVQITRVDMAAVAALVLELGVDGQRADLAILETARTHAAWSGRTALTIDDIRLAAELALPHRMRRQPFTEVKLDEGSALTLTLSSPVEITRI